VLGFDTTPVALAAGLLARLLLLPSCQHVCTAVTLAMSHLAVTSTAMCKASKVTYITRKVGGITRNDLFFFYAGIYHTLLTDTVQGWPARRLSAAAIL